MLKWLTGSKPAWMGLGLLMIIVSVWIAWSVDSYAAAVAATANSVVLGVEEGFAWTLACALGTFGVGIVRWSLRNDAPPPT
jgi:hypothetical protein